MAVLCLTTSLSVSARRKEHFTLYCRIKSISEAKKWGRVLSIVFTDVSQHFSSLLGKLMDRIKFYLDWAF